MTTTDKQLKQSLAKLLPDQILHYDTYYSPKHDAHLKDGLFWIGGDEILDTEWLHVCWLVEQTITEADIRHRFMEELAEIVMDASCYDIDAGHAWRTANASWQQRAIALCKVKGIEL